MRGGRGWIWGISAAADRMIVGFVWSARKFAVFHYPARHEHMFT